MNDGILSTKNLAPGKVLEYINQMVTLDILICNQKEITLSGSVMISEMFEKMEDYIFNHPKFQASLITVPKDERSKTMLSFGMKMSAIQTIAKIHGMKIRFDDIFHMSNLLCHLSGEDGAITLREGKDYKIKWTLSKF